MSDIGMVIVTLLMVFVLWLLLREFFCWYWKINRVVALLESNNRLLETLVGSRTPSAQSPRASATVASVAEKSPGPKLTQERPLEKLYAAWMADPDNSATRSAFMESLDHVLTRMGYSRSSVLERMPGIAQDAEASAILDLRSPA